MSRWTIAGWRLLLTLGGVGATTFACSAIGGVNSTTVGFSYLLLVLTIAASWGLTEAIVASVAAMLCYNYFFLPPVGQFTIVEPENWIALFTFLVTALVASHLSDRAKRQTIEAQNRQLETEQLYALSRAILLFDGTQSIESQAAQQIGQIFGATGVVLFDAQTGKSFQGGSSELRKLEGCLKQAVLQGAHRRNDQGVEIWPISLGGHSVGALAVQGLMASDGAVQALLNLVAIAIERVRTADAANRAELVRQSEEFKSTLLDAVAHEFKTPLTSIKAAATALLAEGQQFELGTRDLLAIIDEESDRLNALVTEAVRMSQIDARKMRLEPSVFPVETLLDSAIASFDSRAEGRIQWIEESPGPICADREMILLAVRQLIDNALKYALPATPVRVWSDRLGDHVLIHVADQGPGIPEGDRERIFEKFYRRQKAHEKIPGSGLGLPIAREIARIHGGDLWVQASEQGGSEFCLSLPGFIETAL